MLTSMRNHAQSWFIKVLLGLIIVTFIISFGVGQFTQTKEVLVEIGGDEVLMKDFNERYQRELENFRTRFPDNAEQLASQFNLRGQVYKTMVNDHLLKKGAQDSGLIVTDQEVSDVIVAQDVFHVNGKFDPQNYRTVLTQNRLTTNSYESKIKEGLLLDKYKKILLAGIVVGEKEIDLRYRMENEQVEVEYAPIKPKKFAALVKLSQAEIQAFYDKNPGLFRKPTAAKIKFFTLSTNHLEPIVRLHKRAVGRYYEKHLESDYSTPRRIRASHILKRVANDLKETEIKKIRASLEKVLAEIRTGKNFADMAKKHSEDLSKKQGGDLGFFSYEAMVAPFSKAAFALKTGQVSGIVRSKFGFHIIKVTDEKPGQVKKLADVKKQIESLLKTKRAERRLNLEADRLPGRIPSEGLDKIAASFKRKTITTGWIDGSGKIKGIGPASPIYSKLRNAKKGATGVLKRNPLQGHVFYVVEEAKAAYTLPFKQVKAKVTQLVRNERERTITQKQLGEAAPKMKTRADFLAFAAKYGGKVKKVTFSFSDRKVPEIGSNPDFQKKAFQLNKTKRVASSQMGGQFHLIYQNKRFLPVDKNNTSKKEKILERMEQEISNHFLEKKLEELREFYTVKLISPEMLLN